MAATLIAEADCPGKIIFIYALVDPITKKRRYVGKTNDIPQRLRAHESEAKYTRTRKSNWIRGLQKLGMRPEIECLDTIPPGGDWIEAEIRWIALGRSEGWGLLNVSDGGDDIPAAAHSPEARIKAAAARKASKRWRTAIAAGHAKRRGVKLSEEHKAKIGAGNRGKKLSAEHVARLREFNKGKKPSPQTFSAAAAVHKGSKHSEEHKDKQRQAMLLQRESVSEKQRNNWLDPEYRKRVTANMIGNVPSPETREKLAQTSKSTWSDPTVREKRTAGIRAAMSTPEWSAKRSEIQKRLWSDPEFRARMKAARNK
jgi:hypothetical protein